MRLSHSTSLALQKVLNLSASLEVRMSVISLAVRHMTLTKINRIHHGGLLASKVHLMAIKTLTALQKLSLTQVLAS